MDIAFSPLTLPNGTTLPNRIAKAAMEENMADADQTPSQQLFKLYQGWSQGGAGLLLSGNVMVDCHAMTGPGGVALEDDKHLAKFEEWAKVGQTAGNHFWLQINHPGRQIRTELGQPALAPSAVPLDLGNLSKLFAPPQEMTETQIEDVISRFVTTSKLAERAGFSGVQIHAAHGYLLCQFLSPLSNLRQDQWGGSLENRSRILFEVVKRVRAAVSPKFCVAVKLNSADFQKGGFDEKDASWVVSRLSNMQIDLIELSGGSYESPVMQGEPAKGSTLAREAYFLEFATDIAKVTNVPIMLTGGIRRREVLEQVMKSGVAVAGIATALALQPDLPNALKRGEDPNPQLAAVTWWNKTLAALARMMVIKYQLNRQSQGLKPKLTVWPSWALLLGLWSGNKRAKLYRKQMELRE
ncbi:NADH:flavin oxidoreductase [Umbelopsis sp. AD052]|nr:NADH:flavin oxidoreductase [Umbelopsis sp. AD052]